MKRWGKTALYLYCGVLLFFVLACENPETQPETASIPLPSLENTLWRWGDRPQGSITVKEFVIESTDEQGIQHGHLNCYRPLDPNQQVYVDWYYYDPATKTGEIEYLTKFYITADNNKLILPQYAGYPHGATFDRIYEDN